MGINFDGNTKTRGGYEEPDRIFEVPSQVCQLHIHRFERGDSHIWDSSSKEVIWMLYATRKHLNDNFEFYNTPFRHWLLKFCPIHRVFFGHNQQFDSVLGHNLWLRRCSRLFPNCTTKQQSGRANPVRLFYISQLSYSVRNWKQFFKYLFFFGLNSQN